MTKLEKLTETKKRLEDRKKRILERIKSENIELNLISGSLLNINCQIRKIMNEGD